MDAITFTVTPRGSTQSLTIDLTALLSRLQTVPDQRKRRGVRYPLPVLLTVAVLAKLCGDSHVYAIADWAQARAAMRSCPAWRNTWCGPMNLGQIHGATPLYCPPSQSNHH